VLSARPWSVGAAGGGARRAMRARTGTGSLQCPQPAATGAQAHTVAVVCVGGRRVKCAGPLLCGVACALY
jgi:hypothetical protein